MNYFLSHKHGRKQEEGTADLPKGAIWKITPCGDGNDAWWAWKSCYRVSDDYLYWVPLNATFKTSEEARQAVKEFIGTVQPVYLDETGEITIEPYMRAGELA